MHDPWTVIELLGALSNLGLGAMVFVIWYFGQRRQATLEMLVEQYRSLIQQDLEKFKVINEAQIHQFQEIWKSFRQLIAENQDAILLNVQVQSQLTEKLARMERDYGQ